MKFYVVKDGLLVRTGDCPQSLISGQAIRPGESAHEGDPPAGVLPPPPPPPTLQQLKDQKWEQIKQARNAAEFSTFQYNGWEFDCDRTSVMRLQGAIQLAQLSPPGFTIDWTLADNSVVTLTAAQLIAAGEALAVHTQTAHAHARQLRQQINAATTQAALDAIVW